jgi:hypothetical protein
MSFKTEDYHTLFIGAVRKECEASLGPGTLHLEDRFGAFARTAMLSNQETCG